MSDSVRPHALQPARLPCPWDSPGESTGVVCHALLQGLFLTQGLNLGVLHCRQILSHRSHQGRLIPVLAPAISLKGSLWNSARAPEGLWPRLSPGSPPRMCTLPLASLAKAPVRLRCHGSSHLPPLTFRTLSWWHQKMALLPFCACFKCTTLF